MPSQFFGQFLLEQGAVTSETLLDALQLQKQIQHPLCTLALEQNYLTTDQLQSLDEAMAASHENPIKLALTRKWISFEHLSKLGERPVEKWMTLGEALLQRRQISLTKLRELSSRFQNSRSKSGSALEAKVSQLRDKQVVLAFLHDTVDVFVHYTGQLLKIEGVTESDTATSELHDVTIAQEIFGDRHFTFVLGLPEELALAVASHMLKQPIARLDLNAIDAVMEFVNVVVGHGCSRLGNEECRVSTHPPFRVVRTQPIAEGVNHAVDVQLRTTKGAMDIAFLFAESGR